MQKLKLTKINHHGLSVKQRIQKIIDDFENVKHLVATPGVKALTMTWKQAKELYRESVEGDVYVNDIYQVLFYDEKSIACSKSIHDDWEFSGKMRYLSIKRHDKEPINDWREFQDIKNQICGEDSEAVELYPNENRLVDTANQYHLWVFPKGYILPFGWQARMTIDTELPGGQGTAKQRKR
jgi:hypothetical protein